MVVDDYDQIMNNEIRNATWPTPRKMISIIDLSFTTLDISAQDREIKGDGLTTPSNHEVIVYDIADPEGETVNTDTSKEVIG